MSRRLLDAAIVLVAASLLLIAALGGIDYDWGILRVRLHSVWRPLLLLVALLAARAWVAAINGADVATRGLLVLILATTAIYARYHVRVCGGLDSYGYISTSSAITSGQFIVQQPLVKYLPFAGASDAVAPLGWVAGRDGHTEVPRFPLGLPIVMALFRMFGPTGPFYVPLVMAYVTIALVFLLVRDTGGNMLAALFTAAILAVDPPFVDYSIQPMSDVPATCWLLAALWLRLSPTNGRRSTNANRRSIIDRAMLAGLCAGMAFLTRPVLLGAAGIIGIVTLDRPWRETVRYGATMLVFIVVQMVINHLFYGDVLLSGYGPASYMFEFSRSRLAANLANFRQSLPYSHTQVIWILWPGALVILRRQKWAWQLSAVAAAAGLPYLFYIVFEGWESLRFLLPTIALVFILAGGAVGAVLGRLKSRPALHAGATIAVFLIALVCATATNRFLRREGTYGFGEAEAKYPLAGEWIERHTPERAVVFAGLHSGSLRYYGHRQTIRWDQIPSDKMSATLHNLEAAGFEPYLALDVASEPPLFSERFRGDPAVRIEQIGRVRVVNFYRFVSAR